MPHELHASIVPTILFTFSIALASASAFGQASPKRPPMEFKGVQLGADKSALQSSGIPFSCKGDTCIASAELALAKCKESSNADCSQTLARFRFGDAHPIGYVVSIKNEKITSVSIHIQSFEFSGIADALIAKYGPPSQSGKTTVQNKLGAKQNAGVVVWDRPDGSINAIERLDDVEEGGITMTLKENSSGAADERREKAKRAASKL